MLVDNIKLTIKAGRGGHGSAHFLRNGQTAKGGPDGGNGGNGGSIYFVGSHNVNDLREFSFKKKIEAENGGDGMGQKMYGRNAQDLTIELPFGTKITDLETEQTYEITDTSPFLIAQGGRGGRGNVEFKTSTNRAPKEFETGKPGQERLVFLELRLIADIGLIGLPNAGKSSILSVLTMATPKIGAYPFTTLEPNIGMLEKLAIADIPGLIEGASKGKGLGIDFLRHIEKTKILLHCIDVSDPTPKKTYNTVRKEFKKFDEALLSKPEYILLTKTDLATPEVVEKATKVFTKLGKTVFTCSIYEPEKIDTLKQTLIELVGKKSA